MVVFARANASLWLPQDPVCGLREIFRDKVGLHGPLRRMPRKFTFTVACAHEDASRTGISREFHVSKPVAHYERALQIKSVLVGRTLQHAGFWLAAATVFGRRGRRIINGLYLPAWRGNLPRHQSVYGADERFTKGTPADAGLSGYHDYRQV